MAEFGSQATELSAPQGAGARVVGPATAGMDLSGVSRILQATEELGEIKQKQEAQSILKQYADNRSKFAKAAEGGKDLARINALRRVDGNKFRQMYSQYIKEFDKIDESYTTNTALSDAAEENKAIREARSAAIKKAGELYPIDANTSEDALNAYIQTVQNAERFNRNMQAKASELEYRQKVLNFSEDEKKVTMKDYARNALQELGNSHLVGLQQTVKDLTNTIGQNPGSYEQSMIQLQGTVSAILANAAPFKESLPEVYDAYSKAMNDVVSSAKEFLNPATRSENSLKMLQNKLGEILAKSQIQLLQKDPRLGVLAASSKLFDPTTLARLNTDVLLNDVVVPLLKKPEELVVGSGPNPVVSSKTEQEKAYSTIESMLSTSLNSTDPEAKTQGADVLNNTLKQIGILNAQENVDPASIARVVSFFASPTFGRAVKELKADPQLLSKALDTMERYFSSQVIPQINQTLNATVKLPSVIGAPTTVRVGRDLQTIRPTTYKNVALTNVIDFVPTATGISIVAKKGSGVDSAYVQGVVAGTQRTINNTLQMEANLSGQTIEQVWEQKKSVIFPELFPAEETPSSKVSYSKEKDLRGIASGTDTKAGVTADALKGVLEGIDTLSEEQKAQLRKALKQISNEE